MLVHEVVIIRDRFVIVCSVYVPIGAIQRPQSIAILDHKKRAEAHGSLNGQNRRQAMLFQYSDGGRAAAGYKGSAGDCGVRAAAIATGREYKKVYDELFRRSKALHSTSRKRSVKRAAARTSKASPRAGVFREVMGPYMLEAGAKWVPLASIGSKPIRVREVAARWPGQRLVMSVARHYSAMVNGVNQDTWQQHPEKRVYGVWVMP
jgi:hypothetical protein